MASFSNGRISVEFKTISGEADRASGILFNVKRTRLAGDPLQRYGNNVALWSSTTASPAGEVRTATTVDARSRAVHELTMTVDGAGFAAFVDASPLSSTRWAATRSGPQQPATESRSVPANNPVLRRCGRRIGLWAKTTAELLQRLRGEHK